MNATAWKKNLACLIITGWASSAWAQGLNTQQIEQLTGSKGSLAYRLFGPAGGNERATISFAVV